MVSSRPKQVRPAREKQSGSLHPQGRNMPIVPWHAIQWGLPPSDVLAMSGCSQHVPCVGHMWARRLSSVPVYSEEKETQATIVLVLLLRIEERVGTRRLNSLAPIWGVYSRHVHTLRLADCIVQRIEDLDVNAVRVHGIASKDSFSATECALRAYL
jgi:hypothetical protein